MMFAAKDICSAQRSQIRSRTAARQQQRQLCVAVRAGNVVTLLDYGAGNARSIRNAITSQGYIIKEVQNPSDILSAEKIIFPGVGAFGQAMDVLNSKGWAEPLKEFIRADRPFLGICLGLQLLFEGSDENGGREGLGIIPGHVRMFDTSLGLPVPHIGWNDLEQRRPSPLLSGLGDKRVYFVHSFRATPSAANDDWVLATSDYGGPFISVVAKGNVHACQFHPEKSGLPGISVIRGFMEPELMSAAPSSSSSSSSHSRVRGLAKRVIACLDVRSNDNGDLVVTKGDQYDVREKGDTREVRNLGKPVELASRYFEEGADEVTFLNITGFRDFPLEDLPMLEVLQRASERCFVPLTVGGGIREFSDSSGRHYSALEVAAEYFRSGADKISIGSDAVDTVEEYLRLGHATGQSSIEQISRVYGAQAVVVSIDPRRVYVEDPTKCKHQCVETSRLGPKGERYCWWQCTVKGGREGRDLGAVELAKAVEELGAGEILLNCIDNDGVGKGFDLELVDAVSRAVTIPVIASSGAGKPEHFADVFHKTNAAAALAAGIFHRQEVSIEEVKTHMDSSKIPVRL